MADSHYSDPAWRAVEQDRLAEMGQCMHLASVLVIAPQYDGYGGGDSGYGSGSGSGRYAAGDWWDFLGARVIKRFGQGNATIAGLATGGPVQGTELLPAADERVHALHAIRFTAANEAAWAKDCPRPKGWRDE